MPPLDITLVRSRLHTRHIATTLIYYPETVSTNADIRRLCHEEGLQEGLAVVADAQSAGRGRMGRTWCSPSQKGLYLSLLLRLPAGVAPIAAGWISSLALLNTLDEFGVADAECKWPNDLLVGGKKVAGILIETVSGVSAEHWCIAGIGCNVTSGPEDFPEPLRDRVTSIAMALAEPPDREALLVALLQHCEQWFARMQEHGTAELLRHWQARCGTIGRRIRIAVEGRTLTGIAESVQEDGSLLLETDSGDIVLCHAGEVQYYMTPSPFPDDRPQSLSDSEGP